MNSYLIIHRRERCIGCNACHEIAPRRWRISRADGKSTLVGSVLRKKIHTAVIDKMELAENLRAMTICPVRVIRIQATKQNKNPDVKPSHTTR